MVKMMMKNPSQKGKLEQLVNKAAASSKSAAPNAAQATGIGQAKMLLAQWVRSKTGEQVTKEQLAYTTTEVEGSKPPEFVCEVVILPIDPSKS